jgi:uncharacterized protein (TIGR03435 family)
VGALIAALARRLQDRPIPDKTGLTGKYDIEVRWRTDEVTPDALANVPEAERPPDVSLFTALEQQAGLKMEAGHGGVEVVVVDSIEDVKYRVRSGARPNPKTECPRSRG